MRSSTTDLDPERILRDSGSQGYRNPSRFVGEPRHDGRMTSEPTSAPVSISQVIGSIDAPWQPRDLVTANDAIVRVARFEGEFPWHHHEEDEMFLCWDGSFRVEMEGRDPVVLGAGDLYVVPAGVRHRPVAESVAHGIMLERPETQQYGN